MSKLYRVINNEGVKEYGVKVGDICLLKQDDFCGVGWFYNENWYGDGIWSLVKGMVEEVLETN